MRLISISMLLIVFAIIPVTGLNQPASASTGITKLGKREQDLGARF